MYSFGISDSKVYVSSGAKEIIRSGDGGETWELTQGLNLNSNLIDIAGSSTLSNRVYAQVQPYDTSPDFYRLFMTNDAGNTWNPLWKADLGCSHTNIIRPSIQHLAISPSNSNTLYATDEFYSNNFDCGTFGGNVYRSSDGGSTWLRTASNPCLINEIPKSLDVDPLNSQVVFVSCLDTGYGDLYRSDNSGDTWMQIINQGMGHLSISSTTTGSLIIVQTSSGFIRSRDNGTTWEAANTGLPVFPGNGVTIIASISSPANDGTFFAVLSANNNLYPSINGIVIYETDNAGDTWYQASHPLTGPFCWGCFLRKSQVAYDISSQSVFMALDGLGLWRVHPIHVADAITGYIYDGNKRPIQGEIVTSDTGDSAYTNENGYYFIPGIVEGTHQITPIDSSSPNHYTFLPSSRMVSVPPMAINQDFIGLPITYSISGQVTDSEGKSIAGVTIPVSTGNPSQVIKSVVTGSDGKYTINDLFTNTYMLTPYKPGYLFTPTVANISLSKNISQNFTGSQAGKKPWLLMFYIAADNDIGKEGVDTKILAYLKNHVNQPAYNIAVMYDGVINGDSRYFYIGDNITFIDKNELDSSDPTTLQDFVMWAEGQYPSDHTALIFVDHGSLLEAMKDDHGGSVSEITPPSLMAVKKISNVLNNLAAIQGKLDILFMDTCMMGSIEDAYQFRADADYYIASESNIILGENPNFLDKVMLQTTPAELALMIVESYQEFYNGAPITLSVSYLPNISRLADKVSTFASIIRSKIQQTPNFANTIKEKVLKQVQSVYIETDTDCLLKPYPDYSEYLDLYDLARQMKSVIPDNDIQAAAQEVMDAIQDDPNSANRSIIYSIPQKGNEKYPTTLYKFSKSQFGRAAGREGDNQPIRLYNDSKG